jgi:propionyl-CoA synthetase
MSKYITYGERSANDFNLPKRDAVFEQSLNDPAGFWKEEAKKLHWSKKFTQSIDTSDKYLHRWFPDGEINICYNCVDRHVDEGRGDDVCFLEDSVYTGTQRAWTYSEIQDRVGRLATIYKK